MQRVVQTLLEEVPSKIDREIKRLQSIEQETAKDTSTGIRKNHEQIQSFHQILNSTSDQLAQRVVALKAKQDEQEYKLSNMERKIDKVRYSGA